MARKQAPLLRQCVTCRGWAPKLELVRVARGSSGDVELDLSGKRPGRGAYLHKSATCLSEALRRRHLERALRQPLPPQVTEAIAALSAEYHTNAQDGSSAGPAGQLEAKGGHHPPQ
ncbi:MAG: YlxR family protein [Candidatus Sericytochromatia bacterium]|nr:YlxR family protein [Candidatus Tanganyikabacteria bacterium]